MIPRTSEGEGHNGCCDGERHVGWPLQRLVQMVNGMRAAVAAAAVVAAVTVVVIVVVSDGNKVSHPYVPAEGKSK